MISGVDGEKEREEANKSGMYVLHEWMDGWIAQFLYVHIV